MAYIGIQPAEKFTSFATQTFSVSATTSYTLDHAVANENEIALFVNNVRQQPGSGKAYTATGTALTLSAATASTDTMYCVFLGRALQTVTPATNSITAAMVGNDLISGKDALTSSPATTDEFLISDAGTLKRIDAQFFQNTPAFMVKKNGTQSISNTTVTKITGWTEVYDTDSAFASDKFTPGVAGTYNFNLTVALDDVGDQDEFYLYIYKNGSGAGEATTRRRGSGTEKMTATMSWSSIADTDDYYEAYVYHNIGSSENVRDDLSTIFSGYKIIE
jgi:hypothetical protein